jgi:signal transduction histidine kinase
MARLESIGFACIGSAGIIAALAGLGWLTGQLALAGGLHGFIPMAPSTCVAFLALVGAALHASSVARRRALTAPTAAAVGLVVLLAALPLLGRPSPWDALLLQAAGVRPAAGEGAMSVTTAGLLCVTSLALAVRGQTACWLYTAMLAVASTFLLGYLYGAPLHYRGPIIPMALSTALAFAVLGTGQLLRAGKQAYPLTFFLGESMRARLLRAFVPVAAASAVVNVWLGVRAATLSEGAPVLLAAVMAGVSTLIAGGVVALRARHIAAVIDAVDASRAQAEAGRWMSRQREVEAQRRVDRAQQDNEFKSQFLAHMSHELRTPLNAILGFADLLDMEHFGPLLPRQKQYVQHIGTSGRHLLALVNDVLDLSKIEAGKMTLAREWTSLDGLVDTIRAAVEPLAAARRIAVRVDIPADFPALYVDALRLKQVLFNLLANAIKFTPEGGEARLQARQTVGEAHLRVEDTGIGIPADAMERLFREFEQLGAGAGEGEVAGTGLGLALSKRLVELHGGAIRAESEVGAGTAFTVSLPLAGGEGDARKEIA